MVKFARSLVAGARFPGRRINIGFSNQLIGSEGLNFSALTIGVGRIAVTVPLAGAIAQQHLEGSATGVGDIHVGVSRRERVRSRVIDHRWLFLTSEAAKRGSRGCIEDGEQREDSNREFREWGVFRVSFHGGKNRRTSHACVRKECDF